MKRRVVITGAGCITPVGNEPDELWNQLIVGQSGVGPITLFNADDFPVRIAAEVRKCDLEYADGQPLSWEGQARQTKFALASAIQATQASGIGDARLDPSRVGVYLGCGEIFPDFNCFSKWIVAAMEGGQFQPDRFVQCVPQICPAFDDTVHEPGTATVLVAGYLGAQGPNTNYTAACVSSSIAIGEAAEVIRRGEADVVLAGGAHSMIHPFGLTGFYRLSTLSTRNSSPHEAYRPFERERDGFVIGEGGAVLVLEELEHARCRRAEIWAELTGYGSTHDAFRITDAHPDARGATRCMQLALSDAGLTRYDVDYINAHGSGTIVNDKMETLAIKSAFSEHAYKIPVSSTKSMTGHLTTACGAVEFLVCVMVIRNGAVPPTINYETPDPECDLDYVPNVARQLPCRHVLSNSFGFGGQNTALIVSRYDD